MKRSTTKSFRIETTEPLNFVLFLDTLEGVSGCKSQMCSSYWNCKSENTRILIFPARLVKKLQSCVKIVYLNETVAGFA